MTLCFELRRNLSKSSTRRRRCDSCVSKTLIVEYERQTAIPNNKEQLISCFFCLTADGNARQWFCRPWTQSKRKYVITKSRWRCTSESFKWSFNQLAS